MRRALVLKQLPPGVRDALLAEAGLKIAALIAGVTP
jgi:hypothetical protein